MSEWQWHEWTGGNDQQWEWRESETRQHPHCAWHGVTVPLPVHDARTPRDQRRAKAQRPGGRSELATRIACEIQWKIQGPSKAETTQRSRYRVETRQSLAAEARVRDRKTDRQRDRQNKEREREREKERATVRRTPMAAQEGSGPLAATEEAR